METGGVIASSAAAIQFWAGSQGHFWAEKERSRPGARFLAMRAASMAMVPDPQKGSQKGSFPRYWDSITMAAARVSRSGATTPTAR